MAHPAILGAMNGRPYAHLSTVSSNEGPITEPSSIGSTSLTVPKEVSHAGLPLQENAPASASNTNFGAAPMEIDKDQGLSLVQWRSRHVDVPMPLCYRQYEDMLPQPPATARSSHPADPNLPDIPTNASTSARISIRAPPFRTARNIFRLVWQFFSSNHPSHDPEEVMTLQDISSVAPAKLDPPTAPHNLTFHPYPN
ncbi:hypothetical protein DFH29DRAFT_1000832 [Suillus ampliporus]|nr:hypothetical protein DFH29DRAFT_1007080 [Suillus ampliporus]KAG0700704.1 hypothetical protein DFH29DRAFT_1000832 [Suillus ampliporus]